MNMLNPKMCTLTATTVVASGLLAGAAMGAGKNLQPSLSLEAPQVRALSPDGTILDTDMNVFRGDAPGSGTPTGTTYSLDHLVGVSGLAFFTLCDPSFTNADNIFAFDGVAESGCDNAGSAFDDVVTVTESVMISGVAPNRTWDITLTSTAADDLYPELTVLINNIPTQLSDGVLSLGATDPLVWDSGLSLTNITWRTEDETGTELFNFDFSPATPTCWEGVFGLTVFNLGLDANGRQTLSEANIVVAEGTGDVRLGNCPFDVTGAGGVPNGIVNIDDLFTVINNFNATFGAGHPDAPGRPIADIVPNNCGNWLVNIDDLFVVINNFGDCPAGDGDVCSEGPVELPMENPISIAFDTTFNETDGPAHPECDQFGTDNEDVFNDSWYLYTAQCSGRVVIDTAGSSYDTKVAVYSGSACPTDGTNLIACNDDDAAAGVTTSRIVLENVASGTVLLIRVGGFAEADEGPGTLNIVCEIPDNDVCLDAVPLTVNDPPITADNSDATLDNVDNCPGDGISTEDGGRWYSFTAPANGNSILVSTCGDNSEFGFSFYPTEVAVYCGGCDVLAWIADASAQSSSCAFGGFAELEVCLEAGEDYLVLVHGVDNSPLNEGYFLSVSETAPCASPIQCGLVGDFLSNPIEIAGDGTFNFDNSMNSDTLPPGVNQCEFGDPQLQDIWWLWTSGTTGFATADLCGSDFDGALSVFASEADVATNTTLGDPGCGDDNAEACPGTFQPEVVFPVTAGETYILVASGWQGGGVGGVLNISTSMSATMGACCVEGVNTGETTETDCETLNGPTAQWIRGEDGTFVCPAEAFASACFSNGPYDDINGIQPNAASGGWIGSGVGEDFTIAVACAFNRFRFDFLDNGGAPNGYNVRLYNLDNLMTGPGSDLTDISFSMDLAVFSENFTGPKVSIANAGNWDGNGDPGVDDPMGNLIPVDRVTLSTDVDQNIAAGNYAVWVQAQNGGSYFLATSGAFAPAFGSAQDAIILGNDGVNDVNGTAVGTQCSFGIGMD